MSHDLKWIQHDGGRADAGFSVNNDAGDCVVRAITIATQQTYAFTYAAIANLATEHGHSRSARDGVHPTVYRELLASWGWQWTPTMRIGEGCTVHLRADELPAGHLVVRLSRHLTAVIDGVIYDTHDPSREGTRCVYGYWRTGAIQEKRKKRNQTGV